MNKKLNANDMMDSILVFALCYHALAQKGAILHFAEPLKIIVKDLENMGPKQTSFLFMKYYEEVTTNIADKFDGDVGLVISTGED